MKVVKLSSLVNSHSFKVYHRGMSDFQICASCAFASILNMILFGSPGVAVLIIVYFITVILVYWFNNWLYSKSEDELIITPTGINIKGKTFQTHIEANEITIIDNGLDERLFEAPVEGIAAIVVNTGKSGFKFYVENYNNELDNLMPAIGSIIDNE